MKVQLITLFIASSCVLLSCAKPPPAASEIDRHKRSLFKNRMKHLYSRLDSVPLDRKGHSNEVKRSFDTLDLDLLFSDPMFAEMEKEQELDNQKSNTFDELNNLENSLHGTMHNPNFDNTFPSMPHNLDNDFPNMPEKDLLNEISNAFPNELHNMNNLPPMPQNLPRLPKIKDEMSNVIPGSQGPFDIPNHEYGQPAFEPYGPPAHAQQIADSLMDEFLDFVLLKEMGMLDNCMGFRRRK